MYFVYVRMLCAGVCDSVITVNFYFGLIQTMGNFNKFNGHLPLKSINLDFKDYQLHSLVHNWLECRTTNNFLLLNIIKTTSK